MTIENRRMTVPPSLRCWRRYAPIKGVVHEMFPSRVVMEGAKVFNLVAVGMETGFFSSKL